MTGCWTTDKDWALIQAAQTEANALSGPEIDELLPKLMAEKEQLEIEAIELYQQGKSRESLAVHDGPLHELEIRLLQLRLRKGNLEKGESVATEPD